MIENKIKPSENRFKIPERQLLNNLRAPLNNLEICMKLSLNSSTPGISNTTKIPKIKNIIRGLTVPKPLNVFGKSGVLIRIKSEMRYKN